MDWYFERIPGAVMLEEFHTAVELILEHLVNQRAKRLSFKELVDAALAKGYLDRSVLGLTDDSINSAGLLIELKDFRKEARHRANRSFEPWLTSNWEQIAIILEGLALRASEV